MRWTGEDILILGILPCRRFCFHYFSFNFKLKRRAFGVCSCMYKHINLWLGCRKKIALEAIWCVLIMYDDLRVIQDCDWKKIRRVWFVDRVKFGVVMCASRWSTSRQEKPVWVYCEFVISLILVAVCIKIDTQGSMERGSSSTLGIVLLKFVQRYR